MSNPKTGPVALRDWERADKVNLEVVTYGWEGRRALVRMHLPMDRDIQRLHDATRGLIRDIKHSRFWKCEFCSRPSRETQVQTSTWVRVDPPRMAIYIHHVCDHDRMSCFKQMEEVHMAMLRLDGRPETPLPRPPRKPEGEVYPLAGACAGCQEDESMDKEMRRCGGCKVTRYCSVACQKEDWRRHKPTCKQIVSVTFDDSEEPR
ncbi:uncharacterized protein TRAVEDRAFT_172379 [Trametes versicolor FP-101664 SS1]|uniref:uncharacterized protein n=1 Tax=Trametes versicolor (strain FP-101664) TaxID=717944 RepID=UPI0004622DFD|nr:uncharacterized protein TRAVEDRAFT_172379 [Trametes versicolor FP-101664 SS1]EIW54763.1 hypothetical protein TRAVEDRAFT_172379 [Trametes versicolor FP-101664 SS1]